MIHALRPCTIVRVMSAGVDHAGMGSGWGRGEAPAGLKAGIESVRDLRTGRGSAEAGQMQHVLDPRTGQRGQGTSVSQGVHPTPTIFTSEMDRTGALRTTTGLGWTETVDAGLTPNYDGL